MPQQQLNMPVQKSVKSWRVAHVLIYLSCIATSLGALLSYRNMNASLRNNVNKCMLYTKPHVELDQKTGRCHFDIARSDWSNDLLCDYVFFAILASFVYAVIAVWFFIMCSPSTRGTPDDRLGNGTVFSARMLSVVNVWKIVPPAVFFSGLLMLFTVIMAWKMSGGLSVFFSNLEAAVHQNCPSTPGSSVPWDSGSVATLYNQRIMAQVFGWLTALCWTLATSTLACRCLMGADFVNTPECPYEPLVEDVASTSTYQTSLGV